MKTEAGLTTHVLTEKERYWARKKAGLRGIKRPVVIGRRYSPEEWAEYQRLKVVK